MEDIYSLNEYRAISALVMEPDAKAYRLALVKMQTECGAFLTERQMHKALQRIREQENFFSSFFRSIYDKISSWFKDALDYLRGASPFNLVNRVQRDLPRLKLKAKEVEISQDVPEINEYDIKEFQRRIRERFPALPPEIVANLVKVKEAHRSDDESLSVTEFIHKWVLLFILYGVAMSLSGFSVFGFGLLRVPLVMLPAVVVAIDDLLYQMTHHKYWAP